MNLFVEKNSNNNLEKSREQLEKIYTEELLPYLDSAQINAKESTLSGEYTKEKDDLFRGFIREVAEEVGVTLKSYYHKK